MADREPEDPKRPGGAQRAEQARIGLREEMWGKALSVKSAENKDDDVCDWREAGFAVADKTPRWAWPAGLVFKCGLHVYQLG